MRQLTAPEMIPGFSFEESGGIAKTCQAAFDTIGKMASTEASGVLIFATTDGRMAMLTHNVDKLHMAALLEIANHALMSPKVKSTDMSDQPQDS